MRRLHWWRRSLVWRCVLSAFAARAHSLCGSQNMYVEQTGFLPRHILRCRQHPDHCARATSSGYASSARSRRSGGPTSGRWRPTAWRCCSWRLRAWRCLCGPAACSFGCRPRWPSSSGTRRRSRGVLVLVSAAHMPATAAEQVAGLATVRTTAREQGRCQRHVLPPAVFYLYIRSSHPKWLTPFPQEALVAALAADPPHAWHHSHHFPLLLAKNKCVALCSSQGPCGHAGRLCLGGGGRAQDGRHVRHGPRRLRLLRGPAGGAAVPLAPQERFLFYKKVFFVNDSRKKSSFQISRMVCNVAGSRSWALA